ncbi:MAG: efflux RND transporter permease subunit [Planctomycetaceae bacterium]|jgi:HAE1 family hydrophobic/amphiphilic exporter-1|nr:efflux RND transporter permease subunit [Planctomycetaceae bacterium]
MFSHFFIDRPIFACVVSLVITLLGAVAIPMLPVEQLPDIVPPVVVVSATYPGASAQDVVNAVAIPLEESLNGVDNMIYMSTQCTSNGSMMIAVTFAVGTDPDIASVLVQNRAKTAEPLLPEEVRRQGLRVMKRGGELVCMITLYEKTDDSAETAEEEETIGGGISGALHKDGTVKHTKSGQYLANYASLYLKDRLARVTGVGEISMFDQRQFSMRIWLDEDAMTARQLSVNEVQNAIREQNVQVSAGRVGLDPVPEGIQNNLAVVTLGRLQDVEQFENLILRVDENGGVLRLKDVALIELGAANYSSEARFMGRIATGIAVAPQAGVNILNVSDGVVKTMESLKDSLARSGLEYTIPFNVTDFVRATVEEFWETLFLCIIFVVITIYMFLQDWRAALIPILTIPVSIVGTFFLIWSFGFSINTMTLFGLILVIGIVVDDAIVVVENTQRLIDEEHLEPHDAAKKSMIQVIGPVVAMVLIMVAVFLPTSMMSGIVGMLYKQFALTIAGAITISGICGITLAPALCAILLRPSIPKSKRFIGFRLFNFVFDGFGKFYLMTVKTFIFVSPIILILWFALVGGLLHYVQILPKGFLPNEDQGVVFMEVRLPEGASSERTLAVLDRVEQIVAAERTITRSEEYYKRGIFQRIRDRFWDKKKSYITSGGVRANIGINGFAFGSGSGSHLGMMVMPLASWDERRAESLLPFHLLPHFIAEHIPKSGMDEGLRIPAIKARIQKGLDTIPEAQFRMFEPPPIQIGLTNGVSYVLLDERGALPRDLAIVRDDLTLKAVDMNPIVMMHSPWDPNTPQIYLDIDRDKAKRMGVSLTELFAALQTYLGSSYVNDFNILGRVFRVNVQAKGEYRDTVENVLRMKVKNNKGEMVPISAFTTPVETSGPQLLTRYNMFPSVAMTGILPPNRSTGEGIQKMEELSKSLPDGYSYDWTGLTYQEKRVGTQTAIFFAVSVLFAFLILAAQYESWSSPLIIMMAVPLGVAGSLLAVLGFAMAAGAMPEINLYTQIGLLMMVGLSAKNAVLITEFAREKRVHEGVGLVQSAYEAGRLRLRPIFMTSFAFILGVSPLVWADGAGSAARNAIGGGVFGGLLTETFAGVYVTPVLFVLIQGTAEWCNRHISDFLHKSRTKGDRALSSLDESTLRHGD